MDLSFTPEQETFREEVRAFIQEAMPPHIREKAEKSGQFTMDEIMEWHRILYKKGWVAPHWPKEYGGAGFDAAQRFIFTEEMALAGAPGLSPFGLSMVGPLIMHFGTPAQKERFLPKILSGEEVWCQGYSEPNAGSDLASLKCKAEDKGDHFVVNGQKTWTTYGQYADWIFCLVRTDSSGKKQEGISFLLIDMKTPGVKVVPMLTIGGTPAFCDTYFEDVEVPKENLLGPQNGGWTLAKALLGHERTMIGGTGPLLRSLNNLKRIAAECPDGQGQTLADDPSWRRRAAALEMRYRAHEMVVLKQIAEQQAGRQPGPEASIMKIVGTTLGQQIDELTMDTMGLNSLNWFNDPPAVPPLQEWVGSNFCYNRATTIFGGSNEIQRNIMAKMLLGLPTLKFQAS
ncbi:MAG: pimeloyl-CoA dehydrogenase large subunit [Candidatus Dadabacteria bacterium]|nr:MAG: pimeloyl-CoA dehydrogenase large subunit [Candidatus Dadabacteria bacterium]